MSVIGSENLVDGSSGSVGSGRSDSASQNDEETAQGQRVASQDQPERDTGVAAAGQQGQNGQAETPARTVTRSADRTEPGDGEDGPRTITRLVTRTRASVAEVTPSATASRSAAESSDGADVEQVASTQADSTRSASSQQTSDVLASSTVAGGDSSSARTDNGTVIVSSSASDSNNGSTATSAPDIIQIVTSTPNINGSSQVSTFNPSPSQTALITAPPSGTSDSSANMDMLNMSPMTMSTATGNRAAVQSENASAPDNLFMPGSRLFPLGVTIIVLGGLFLLISTAIILIRVFGWNSKRRFRKAIPSFINIDSTPDGGGGPAMFDPAYEKPAVNIASTNPFRDRDSGSSFGGGRALDVELGRYAAGATTPGTQMYAPRQDLAAYAPGGNAAYGGAYFVPPAASVPASNAVNAPGRPLRARPPPDGVGYDVDNRPLQNPFDTSPRGPTNFGALDVPLDVSDMGSPVPSFGTGILNLAADSHATNRPSLYATGRPEQPALAGAGGVGRSLTSSSQSSASTRGTRPAYRPARQANQGEVLVIGHSGASDPFADGSNGYVPATRHAARGSNASLGSLGSSMYTSSSGEFGDVDWVTPGVRSNNRKSYLAGEGPSAPAGGDNKLGKPAVWGSGRI